MFPPTSWPGSSVGLECQPVTLEVEGSSPFRVAISALVAQSVEHVTENHSVGGSIPPQGTFPGCGSSSVGRAPPCQGGGRESEPRLPLHFIRRHSQVVRRRSAKPLCSGPNPDGASSSEQGSAKRLGPVLLQRHCRPGLILRICPAAAALLLFVFLLYVYAVLFIDGASRTRHFLPFRGIFSLRSLPSAPIFSEFVRFPARFSILHNINIFCINLHHFS